MAAIDSVRAVAVARAAVVAVVQREGPRLRRAIRSQSGRCSVRPEGAGRDAVIVGAHGAYRKGWRNASPALSRGTGNTSKVEVPLSATTICVSSESWSHSSETV